MSKEPKLKPIEKVFQIMGSKTALAKHFGITPWAVCKWEKQVPVGRCADIEALTNKQVTKKDLRPDIFS